MKYYTQNLLLQFHIIHNCQINKSTLIKFLKSAKINASYELTDIYFLFKNLCTVLIGLSNKIATQVNNVISLLFFFLHKNNFQNGKKKAKPPDVMTENFHPKSIVTY